MTPSLKRYNSGSLAALKVKQEGVESQKITGQGVLYIVYIMARFQTHFNNGQYIFLVNLVM